MPVLVWLSVTVRWRASCSQVVRKVLVVIVVLVRLSTVWLSWRQGPRLECKLLQTLAYQEGGRRQIVGMKDRLLRRLEGRVWNRCREGRRRECLGVGSISRRGERGEGRGEGQGG